MKVLHVPYTWFPAPCGGTEVYVRALAEALAGAGWRSEVAVADPGVERAEHAVSAGLATHRLPVPARLPQRVLYGAGEPASAAAFAQLLAEQRPDVVHFHAFTPAVSALWAQAARAAGTARVYTYHTPTLACMRGTLLRWGQVPCDGGPTPLRCAACALHGRGLAKAPAWALALLSPLTAPLLPWSPFRAWPLARQRQGGVRRWLGGMSRVTALCAWSRAVLERQGVPAARLRMVRHGLDAGVGMEHRRPACDEQASRLSPMPATGADLPLKLAFFGRVDRAKGLGTLADALRQKPDLRLELHCHLIGEASAGPAMRSLVDRLRGDPRVQVHPPEPPESVVRVMAGYDAVLVPSQGFETGPLVVLEAFAAGVPVIGSDLGGIAEWVTQDLNGLLCPPGDAAAWALALARFTTDAALRARLRAGVRPPPGMAEVAARMAEIYQEAMEDPG